MEHPLRGDPEPGRFELLAVLVLVDLERAGEHVGLADLGADRREQLAAAGRDPELGLRHLHTGPERLPPDPGHDVAPVVEVPVGEGD